MGYRYRRPSIKILGTTIRKNKNGYSFSSKTITGARKTYNTATGKTTVTRKTIIPGLSYQTVTGGKSNNVSQSRGTNKTLRTRQASNGLLNLIDVGNERATSNTSMEAKGNVIPRVVDWVKRHWPMIGTLVSFIGCLFQVDIFALLIIVFGIAWIVQGLNRVIQRSRGKKGIDSSEKKDDSVEELVEKEVSRLEVRRSNSKYPVIDRENNRYLRYSYYDVKVRGVENEVVDFSNLKLDTFLSFDDECGEQYEEGAILVLYEGRTIGYLPKGTLTEMMLAYSDGVKRQVCGFINMIDEENKTIQMALGFYDTIGHNITVIDTKLVGVTQETDYSSRQSNLSICSEGDAVTVDYDYDEEKYHVQCEGFDIGDVSKKDSKILKEHEDEGEEFIACIDEIEYDDNDNVQCIIKVLIK